MLDEMTYRNKRILLGHFIKHKPRPLFSEECVCIYGILVNILIFKVIV